MTAITSKEQAAEQKSIFPLLHSVNEVAPPGRTFFEFQAEDIVRACVDFRKRKGVYLGHSPGCGKTVIAIGCVNFLIGEKSRGLIHLPHSEIHARWDHALRDMAFRVLVLCPRGAKGVWRAQLPAWGPSCFRGDVLESSRDRIHPDWHYTICTYDLALRKEVLPQIVAGRWNVLICDEAHQLGNEGAKRGKLVYGNLWDSIADKVLLLSGSISRNSIEQLWAPFRRLAPDVIPPYRSFVDRFCFVEWEEKYVRGGGKKNIPTVRGAKSKEALTELSKIARGNFLIRRLKKHVDAQLPEKTFQVIRLKLPDRELRALDRLGREFSDEKIDQALEGDTPDPALATAYRELGMAKLNACLETTLEIFHEHNPDFADVGEFPRPLIVFAYHRDVYTAGLEALQATGLSIGGFSPDASSRARDAAEREFQEGRKHVFFATYSASEAITLHRSSTVVVWELAWGRFMNEQAWDRAHRLGQKKQVEVKVLLSESDIDNKVYTGLKRKLREHGRMFG